MWPRTGPVVPRTRRLWKVLAYLPSTLDPPGPSLMLWRPLLDLALLCPHQDLPPKAPFPTPPPPSSHPPPPPPPPTRLARFFRGCHAPFPCGTCCGFYALDPSSCSPGWTSSALHQGVSSLNECSRSSIISGHCHALPGPTVTSQTLPNVQDWMKDMRDALLSSMKDQMIDLLGVAPPQLSMGLAVPTQIMGPDALRPPSSSGDRTSPWVPRKPGSKRADGSSRSRSPSGDWSLSSRDGQSRRRPHSLSSSSNRLSPPSKWPRHVSHSPQQRSRSPVISGRGPGPQRHHTSPSHTDRHRSRSPASRRQCRTRPSPSRRPSPAGMTRRPARDVSLSPRHRSRSSLARWSPWGRPTSPRTRRSCPNHRGCSSCSTSSTPCPRRTSRSCSRSPRSRSSSWDRHSRPFTAEQQLLHLRDQSPVPSQEQDQDADLQSSSNDNVMSAEAVRILFADTFSVCRPFSWRPWHKQSACSIRQGLC